jgi:hypothetical protein
MSERRMGRDHVKGAEHRLHVIRDRHHRPHCRAAADHCIVSERRQRLFSKTTTNPEGVIFALADGLHLPGRSGRKGGLKTHFPILGEKHQFIIPRPLAVGRKGGEGTRLEEGVTEVEDENVGLLGVELEPVLWDRQGVSEGRDREGEGIRRQGDTP